MGIVFTSITLNTPNLANMVRFYEILGCQFRKVPVTLGSEVFRSSLSGFEICLMSLKSAEKISRPTLMLAFRVDHLENKLQQLQSVPGVMVLLDPSDMADGRKAIVQDPDGQSVELLAE